MSAGKAKLPTLADLQGGPVDPGQLFTCEGVRFDDVYAMAAWLVDYYRQRTVGGGVVCLAAEDRGVVAAALLASLAGGRCCCCRTVFQSRFWPVCTRRLDIRQSLLTGSATCPMALP